MRLNLLHIVVFTFLLCLLSCLKNESIKIDADIRIYPEYAIPIGSPELELGTFLNSLNGLNPIDTIALDTLEGFIYEDELYQIPNNIEHVQNVAFTMSGVKETDEYITAAVFRTNVINQIPAEILLQVYLLDASDALIDSLYSQGPLIIQAAEINSDGYVISVSELLKHDTPFDDNKLEMLTQVASLQIYNKVIIEDVSNVFAKYYENQDLWLQLAVQVSTDLKLND